MGNLPLVAGRTKRYETGEIHVLSKWKWASVLALASLVSACGGGGDPTARGSIAYDPSTGRGAIVVDYTSQPEANSDALSACGAAGCSVVLEFSGNGTCGSIAVSGNGAWGAASGGSKELADSRAVADCQKRGGGSCAIPQDLTTQCN
ncbi:DUF4189 domain-containing protein [Hydrogenophaga sp. MI9]|uniref:DUF4189 domain-containing protein n=1 Tax=Hydrogenophaga sp. MI9 TaxID=3453719 RepID=UPI003EED22AD